MITVIRKNLFILILMFWYVIEFFLITEFREISGIPKDLLNNLSNYLVLGALLVQIVFFQKYTEKEKYIIFFLTLPIVISAAFSSYYPLLSTWLFVVAAKETDFDKVLRIIYRFLIVAIPFVFIMFFCGVISEDVIIRNEITRHSWGFVHPNELGMRIFELVAYHCYIKRNQMRIIDYVYILLAILFLYFVPNSQSPLVCMAALLIMLLFYKGLRKYQSGILMVYQYALIILAGTSNFFSVLFSVIGVEWSPLLKQFDKWMSKRFSQCYRDIQIFGVSFWGQHVYISAEERSAAGLSTTETLYLDNAYMALLIRLGIITFLVFSFLFIFSMIYFNNKKYNMLLIFFAVYALYGVMESGWFSVKHNIFLLAISAFLYCKDSYETTYSNSNISGFWKKLADIYEKRNKLHGENEFEAKNK